MSRHQGTGLDPEHQRLRDVREARRAEVEKLAGFTDAPPRPMAKSQARRIATRQKGRKRH
jgi:hypothetical protein